MKQFLLLIALSMLSTQQIFAASINAVFTPTGKLNFSIFNKDAFIQLTNKTIAKTVWIDIPQARTVGEAKPGWYIKPRKSIYHVAVVGGRKLSLPDPDSSSGRMIKTKAFWGCFVKQVEIPCREVLALKRLSIDDVPSAYRKKSSWFFSLDKQAAKDAPLAYENTGRKIEAKAKKTKITAEDPIDLEISGQHIFVNTVEAKPKEKENPNSLKIKAGGQTIIVNDVES